MAKQEQWLAEDDVKKLAGEIIDAHHTHLCGARILYLMRSPSWSSKGATVGGTARLASATDRALTGFDDLAFVITLNWSAWEDMPEPTRRALLDHELSHCDGSDEDGWSTVGHDVEDFRDVVERHGLWHETLREFGETVRQLELPLVNAARRAASGSGGDVESVTISSGGRSVTMTGDTTRRMQDAAKRLRAVPETE